MTTTSLLPHKPPPLKPRNNSAIFLRTNYYGSIGRPSNGKRKSAVELLEETKAFYVKSESVLDAKQELKNADHLHVRSPTLEVQTMLRSPAPPIINGGGPFPFMGMCLSCPPYPHQHFEHFDHYQLHQNAHNHHLSQGSLHQQQHHLSAPTGSAGGNSSGPPSVESGGTASTGSTGGGGVTAAITTLGRSSKHHLHSHHHHHHHHNHHHAKSHRSSSTGSSGSRHLQENIGLPSGLFIEQNVSSLKTSTMGRTKRSVQPPGSLLTPKQLQSQLKKDSSNVLAALLPGMSFTLPAQSSLQKQTHHLHHHHHHHQQSHHHQLLLQQQQQALASLTNSTGAALSLPSGTGTTSTVVGSNHATTTTTSSLTAAGNGLRGNGGGGVILGANTVASSSNKDKHASLVSANNSSHVPVITSTSAAQLHQTAGQHAPSKPLHVKPSNHGAGHHRERNVDDDSPPPLPPKSPRITSKPARPHDFPQQLQLQVVDSSLESAAVGVKSSNVVPPPPPRRQSQKDPHTKYLRLMQDQSSAKLPPHSILDPTQSMTLPSPILPPTPPPDVVMESPMSDSGPIISPPPAFSTPVTPMIDRQNSATSDKSGKGIGKTGGASATTATTSGTNNASIGTTTANAGRLRSLSQSTSHYHNITGFSLASTTNITSSTTSSGAATTGASTTSKSNSQQQQQHHHYHAPLSGTVSMSAISENKGTINNKNSSTRNNKSIPDLSSADISIRYSPMSRSRSNSSPMSPTSSPEEDDDDDDDDDEDDDGDEDPTSSSIADNGHDGDDDSSEKGQLSSISPKLLTAGVARRNSAKMHTHHHSHHHSQPQQNKKVTLIPKSVTENFLYKVGATGGVANTATSSANLGIIESDVIKSSSMSPKTEANQQPKNKGTAEAPSPARRPILRSKSDLSHRYAKAEKSATLTSGFTLVHVDLGLPPPLPMHSSVSTNDFSTNLGVATTSAAAASAAPNVSSSGAHKSHYHHHHHHIYQTPNSVVNTASSAVAAVSHYHEPHNPHQTEIKRQTKSASDLERFFDMLGLENNPTPAPISLTEIKESTAAAAARAKTGSESPVFFSSVSSIDSAPRRSGSVDSEDSPIDDKLGSRTVGGYGKFGPAGGPSILVQHGEPSIVERNARVIKWLFNCRKAMERR